MDDRDIAILRGINAACAEPSTAVSISGFERALDADGYVVVPKEPTEAMLDVVDTLPQSSDPRAYARLLFRAMIAARPDEGK